MKATLLWNTGRLYTEEGQIIGAVADGSDILFKDFSRGIFGRIKECNLSSTMILTRYDKHNYKNDFMAMSIKR